MVPLTVPRLGRLREGFLSEHDTAELRVLLHELVDLFGLVRAERAPGADAPGDHVAEHGGEQHSPRQSAAPLSNPGLGQGMPFG